ncbi:MAG: hypothetical protein ACM3PP_13465 [Candidatus Saccharibacteria bacterium]
MDELIFSSPTCRIFRRDGKHFIRYDSGELVSKLVENEISKEEVKKIEKSVENEYEVIIAAQNREYKRTGEYFRKMPIT